MSYLIKKKDFMHGHPETYPMSSSEIVEFIEVFWIFITEKLGIKK